MPQSLAKVYIHLVFSTKNQMKLIDIDIEKELYPYMAKLFRECDSPSITTLRWSLNIFDISYRALL
jgi:hypothetical protein